MQLLMEAQQNGVDSKKLERLKQSVCLKLFFLIKKTSFFLFKAGCKLEKIEKNN